MANHSAKSSQPRIVPAIPLKLTKRSQPTTPNCASPELPNQAHVQAETVKPQHAKLEVIAPTAQKESAPTAIVNGSHEKTLTDKSEALEPLTNEKCNNAVKDGLHPLESTRPLNPGSPEYHPPHQSTKSPGTNGNTHSDQHHHFRFGSVGEDMATPSVASSASYYPPASQTPQPAVTMPPSVTNGTGKPDSDFNGSSRRLSDETLVHTHTYVRTDDNGNGQANGSQADPAGAARHPHTNGHVEHPQSGRNSPMKNSGRRASDDPKMTLEPILDGPLNLSDDTVVPALQLRDFLMSRHFGSARRADTVINIWAWGSTRSAIDQPLTEFPAHAILLERSPALERQMAINNPSMALTLFADEYTHVSLLLQFLRHLYGAPLQLLSAFDLPLIQLDLTGPSPQLDSRGAVLRMELAIGILSAAAQLDLADIVERGIQLVRISLRWDTLEAALSFAENGPALSSAGLPHDPAVREYCSRLEVCRNRVMDLIITYIVEYFPVFYQTDKNAPELGRLPRTPGLAAAVAAAKFDKKKPKGKSANKKPLRADPRLSRIQFGNNAPETVSWGSTLVTSVMISLPFRYLESILWNPRFCRLGFERVVEVTGLMVALREVRRVQAVEARNEDLSQPGTDALTDNLRWEEYVNYDCRAPGHLIARRPAYRPDSISTIKAST